MFVADEVNVPCDTAVLKSALSSASRAAFESPARISALTEEISDVYSVLNGVSVVLLRFATLKSSKV